MAAPRSFSKLIPQTPAMRRYSYPAKALKILAFLEVGDKRTAPVARLQLPGVKVETGDVPRFLGLEPWSVGRLRGCRTVVVLEILKPSSWEVSMGMRLGHEHVLKLARWASTGHHFRPARFFLRKWHSFCCGTHFSEDISPSLQDAPLIGTLLRTVRTVTFQDLVDPRRTASSERLGKSPLKETW